MSEDHTGNWGSTQRIIQESALIPSQFSGRPYAPHATLARSTHNSPLLTRC